MKKIRNRPILIVTLLLSIFCVNMVLSGPVSAATIHINESSTYNTSNIPLNQQIQDIINSANKGDTIQFMGSYYENLFLVINKPLNIISHVQTIISGTSNSANPIFLITGSGSSGTNITGFNLKSNNTDGIVIRSTGKITISKNNLNMVNGTGIRITGSSNINIKNNMINNSKTGLSITNSKNVVVTGNNIKDSANDGIDSGKSQNLTINKNQISSNGNDGISAYDSQTVTVEENSISNNGNNGITLKNTTKTKINKNNINQNKGHGVYFNEKVNNTQITSNNITGNQGIGIDLDKSGANTYINGNNIIGNKIGININDFSDNLVISQNTITYSVRNDADDEDGASGVGINFGASYWYSPTFNVNTNVIFGNQRREVEIRDTEEPVYFGANWYGHSDPSGCNLCPKCHTKYIQAVVTQSGSGIYNLKFYMDYDKKIMADGLPSFDAYVFLSDGTVLIVPVVNGKASIKIDPSLKVVLVKATYQRFEPEDITYAPDPSNTNPGGAGGNPGSGGSGGNPGSGGSGGNPGSGGSGPGGSGKGSNGNSGSGSTSGSSSNDGKSTGTLAVGAAAAASASSSAGSSAGQDGSSSSQSGSKSTSAQELFLNDPVKNPQIWGIIGVVILIILVILAYYRKDLMNMIKNSK